MLNFLYWVITLEIAQRTGAWKIMAPNHPDLFSNVVDLLLHILVFILFLFLLSFATQYLSCLIFKRKWLQRLPSILLIVQEISFNIVWFVSILSNLSNPGTNTAANILMFAYFLGPFVCIAGAAVARRVHRWICKKKEKKAQALNPAQ